MKDQDIVITRVFDAPREKVWKAWTDPKQQVRWFGPKTYTAHSATIDLRVGGRSISAMRSPEGKDIWSTGVYREIVPLEKIVLTDSFADEHGNEVPASAYGMEGDWPEELLITVTFKDYEGGKTLFTLRHTGLPEIHGRDAANGWNESFDKLAEILK